MSRLHAATVYRSTEDDEWEIDVCYTVTPGAHDTRTDPGYPAEIEIDSAVLNGASVDLTDAEIARILENHEWDDGPDPDDARDRMIDAQWDGGA